MSEKSTGDILVKFTLVGQGSGIYDRTGEGSPRVIWEFEPERFNPGPLELVSAGVDLARDLATHAAVTIVDLDLMKYAIKPKKDKRQIDEGGQGTEERARFLRQMSGDGGYVSQYIETGEANV